MSCAKLCIISEMGGRTCDSPSIMFSILATIFDASMDTSGIAAGDCSVWPT